MQCPVHTAESAQSIAVKPSAPAASSGDTRSFPGYIAARRTPAAPWRGWQGDAGNCATSSYGHLKQVAHLLVRCPCCGCQHAAAAGDTPRRTCRVSAVSWSKPWRSSPYCKEGVPRQHLAMQAPSSSGAQTAPAERVAAAAPSLRCVRVKGSSRLTATILVHGGYWR